LEATPKVCHDAVASDLVEVGRSEFSIGDTFREDVAGGDQDLVSDGEGCAQRTAARL
jgi:hypothetical protein